MKKISVVLALSTALSLSACGQAGEQFMNPDTTFALFDQPEIKGVNDTQEKMAKEAFAAGEYGRAAQFYRQLITSEKGTPEQKFSYKLGMADSARRLGDNQAALGMFEDLYKDNPTNIEVMEGRALTLMATGKTTDAGRAFADVIEKDPKRWRSLNALGILFVTKNMIPEAIAYYTEALDNSPDNAAVLNNVGLSYAVDRQFPRAITALEQAARVSTTPAQKKQIELNQAMVQGVSGDMEAARALASKYYEGAALDNNLGLYAHLAKDNNLAKTYLNMALSQSPSYYERAWENLDAIADESHSDSPASKSPVLLKTGKKGKLPALDALKNTALPGADSAKKPALEAEKKAEPAKKSESKTLVKPEVKTESEPAAKSADVEKKADVKADEAEKATPKTEVEKKAEPVKEEAKPEEKAEKPAAEPEKKTDDAEKVKSVKSETGSEAKADETAEKKSEEKTDEKSKEKSADKPAGLIVGPTEGD